VLFLWFHFRLESNGNLKLELLTLSYFVFTCTYDDTARNAYATVGGGISLPSMMAPFEVVDTCALHRDYTSVTLHERIMLQWEVEFHCPP
jgi:hypothetical protein